jgi:catechol 2,3-dioxygenase-like lactoylglutathione lyase family enzyme
MEVVARQNLSPSEVDVLWGLSGHDAETLWLETPGTPYGIRVLQLTPTSSVRIRDPKSGYDCNALKVIDFFTADFDRARATLEQSGFQLKDEIAEYETESGHITEGHLWGPDGVVCALVAGPREFLSEFVSITDRIVSEVHSVSAPVDDQPAVVAFYASLGLNEVHRYEVTDESFQHLVGAKDPLHIRAINVGSARHEPYLGIIHYGLPTGSYESLAERARLPHRGLVGATILVPDVQVATAACRQAGATLLAGPVSAQLLPFGEVTSAAVRAPHGVLHQLLDYQPN